MARRQHGSELVSATAACQRCAWRVDGNNAQGLAAQHYDKYHHRVVVEVTNRITYGAVAGKASAGDGQGKML